jgi:hypothetical protein
MSNNINKVYAEAIKALSQEVLDDRERWYKYVDNLPFNQQIVYTVILFHTQVENGGFHQYFFNAYGMFSFLTIKNLVTIKAYKRSKLLEDAIRKVNSENLNEKEFRDRISHRKLDKIADFDSDLFNYLTNLDDQYYGLVQEEIYKLLETFLNRDEIS